MRHQIHQSLVLLFLTSALITKDARAFSAVSPASTGSSSLLENDAPTSRALESILSKSDGMTQTKFFSEIWQQCPALFRASQSQNDDKPPPLDNHFDWNEEALYLEPYEELVRKGWQSLTDLLEQPSLEEPTMVIHNGHVQHPQDWMPAYQTTSLYAPYLNGSTVMQAHADCLSPWLAAFCNDLQSTFPYVYANTYLTPPHSRALNLHADDRDVLVLQLVGSKHWQVMQHVPIPYPYSHEQVGKGDLPVPDSVLQAGLSLTCTLQPGDVLYIPRGHCHRAQCTDDLSFHVTIAIATFDWTLAGILPTVSQSILARVPDYKKGILPLQGTDPTNPEQALHKQIDDAIQLLQQQITPQAILHNLQTRIQSHRLRAQIGRDRQLDRGRNHTPYPASAYAVGSLAARHVTFATKFRAATREEKLSLERTLPPLLVREELASDVASILQQLQTETRSLSELKSCPSRSPVWCDLTWLGFAKQAVESAELAIVE